MKVQQKNRKSYPYITVWTEEDQDDILISSYQPGLHVDINIARDLINSRLDYCQGKPMYVLIDFTNVKSVTKEAREYMNHPEGGLKGVLGGAFLSGNVVATLFVNLYLKLSAPVIPAKFFTKRADAITWLKELKEKEKKH